MAVVAVGGEELSGAATKMGGIEQEEQDFGR
jgi:hypothetical protein